MAGKNYTQGRQEGPRSDALSSSKESSINILKHTISARSLSANTLDEPSRITPSAANEALATDSGLAQGAREVHVPAVLDMAAVTWQTRRAPAPSRHENSYTSGTCVQYLSQSFVDQVFSGVLKISVLDVAGLNGALDERAGIRVTFKERQAVAGFHTSHDGGRGDAYLWLHKGEEAAGSTFLTFEHIEAGSREDLAVTGTTETIAKETLNIITSQTPSPPARQGPYSVVLKLSPKSADGGQGSPQFDDGGGDGDGDGVSLRVAVTFVPLKSEDNSEAQQHSINIKQPEDSLDVEQSMLRRNIDLGAQLVSMADSEGVTLENLPDYNACNPRDSLFKCALTLGRLFEGGFWRHGRGAEPLAYIQNKASKTEVLAFWNPDLQQIAVAFDSTRLTEFKDALTNIRILPVIFDEGGELDGERFRRWLRVFRGSRAQDHQLVHAGFLTAWRSVQHTTDLLIKQAVQAKDDVAFRRSSWKTTFTGHSLGGALATLATASATANGRGHEQVELVTFGCPHVGNRKFLNAFQDEVPQTLRVFNDNDSVTYVPRSTGFHATRPAMSLLQGKRSDGTSVIKISFPDGDRIVTVAPGHPISAQVHEEYVVPYRKINNLWDRTMFEAELLYNIVSSRGFKTHDEDQYITSLLTMTTQLCSEMAGLSPQAQQEVKAGLAEAQRLLNEYNNPTVCVVEAE